MEAFKAFLSQEVDSIVMKMPEADHSEYEKKYVKKIQEIKHFNGYSCSPIICENHVYEHLDSTEYILPIAPLFAFSFGS